MFFQCFCFCQVVQCFHVRLWFEGFHFFVCLFLAFKSKCANLSIQILPKFSILLFALDKCSVMIHFAFTCPIFKALLFCQFVREFHVRLWSIGFLPFTGLLPISNLQSDSINFCDSRIFNLFWLGALPSC
jgi:hypothetical protein